MTRTYAFAADGMTVMARADVRAFRPCPTVASWSPISLGINAGQKHGQPRRTEVST